MDGEISLERAGMGQLETDPGQGHLGHMAPLYSRHRLSVWLLGCANVVLLSLMVTLAAPLMVFACWLSHRFWCFQGSDLDHVPFAKSSIKDLACARHYGYTRE